MRRILFSIVIFIFFASDALSQIMVRESFKAAAQAGKPASFLWSVENLPDDVNYGTIDAGLRYTFEIGLVSFGPTVEWHKLTREDGKYDTFSIGGSGELRLSYIKIPWIGNPYVTTQIAFENNRLLEEWGGTWSISNTFFSNSTAAPGSSNTLWKNSMIRYYPHFGFEGYSTVSKSISNATLGFVQLNVEFWPWIGRIQGLGTYTIVERMNGENLPDDLNRLSLSLNFFLDPNQHVGLGVEYIDLANPKDGFTKVKRTIIGFKVKI